MPSARYGIICSGRVPKTEASTVPPVKREIVTALSPGPSP